MNAIDKFRIAPQLYSLEEIKEYYDLSIQAINCEYSTSNLHYEEQFYGWTEKEIEDEAESVKRELSHVCSMCVMAYIESLFRIDSYVRTKHKYKGQLTDKIKAMLVTKKSIPLVRFEDLLDVWKQVYCDETELFRKINSCFKFRHWIAHGRYWKLDDNIDVHFDFADVFMLAQSVETILGGELRTQDAIGEPHKVMTI